MKLSPSDIEHISRLARLHISEEEKKTYANQLSVVLDYVEMLNEVDTEGVPETTQVTGLEDVFREDEVAACDESVRHRITAIFPEQERGLLKVRGVFE